MYINNVKIITHTYFYIYLYINITFTADNAYMCITFVYKAFSWYNQRFQEFQMSNK